MKYEQIPVMGTNCYLFWDEFTKNAACIDPGFAGRKIAKKIQKLDLQLNSIFITHSHAEYATLLSDRITGILSVCAKLGYKKLVLGAWGCGSFGNDPMLVARLFEKNIRQFDGAFDEIEFAVLGNGSNFDCFYRVFVLREFE